METIGLVVLSSLSLTLFLLLKKKKKRAVQRKFRVQPYLTKRNQMGRFCTSVSLNKQRYKNCVTITFQFQDMVNNENIFSQNFHMDRSTFDMIHRKIYNHLMGKRNTRPNDSISPKMKLVIALEFFASGTIGRHMASIYRIGKSSFCKIIDDVCDALICTFRDEFMNGTNANWLSVANDFNYKWNFPNCVGAIDGKHIAIHCPANSGSLFYNYKVIMHYF